MNSLLEIIRTNSLDMSINVFHYFNKPEVLKLIIDDYSNGVGGHMIDYYLCLKIYTIFRGLKNHHADSYFVKTESLERTIYDYLRFHSHLANRTRLLVIITSWEMKNSKKGETGE